MTVVSNEQLKTKFPQLNDIRELKTGGQKVVYEAIHNKYGNVVLKIVNHDGKDDRVLREIEIVKRNAFPNVPSIYEVGNIVFDEGSFIYICEQRITGTDLRDILDTREQLPLTEALAFMSSMLNTVTKLEEQGIALAAGVSPDEMAPETNGHDDIEIEAASEDILQLDSPCKWCSYANLCGARGGPE